MRRPPRAEQRPWPALSIGLLAAGVIAVLALHLLRRDDLPPGGHRLSEYALGAHGWLMTVAFVAIGAGLLALAAALVTARHRPHVIVPLVAVAGVGMVVSGAFRTGPERSGELADAVHSAASGLATLALIGAVVCWAWSPPRHRRLAGVLAVAAVALGAASPVLHRTSWTGSSQRALWAVLLAWAFLAARALMSKADRDVSARSATDVTIEA